MSFEQIDEAFYPYPVARFLGFRLGVSMTLLLALVELTGGHPNRHFSKYVLSIEDNL